MHTFAFRAEDGSSTFLLNIDNHRSDYKPGVDNFICLSLSFYFLKVKASHDLPSPNFPLTRAPSLPYLSGISSPLYPVLHYHKNNSCVYKLRRSSLCNILNCSHNALFLGPHKFLSTLFRSACDLCSSLKITYGLENKLNN
jgi:hypothetical protein